MDGTDRPEDGTRPRPGAAPGGRAPGNGSPEDVPGPSAPEPGIDPGPGIDPEGEIPGITVPGVKPTGPPRIHDLDTAEARALAAEREETRRLIEAGARTPDELRALAERLRAQRAREEQLWRDAVKPGLKRSRSSSDQARRALAVGGALLACVALVLVAAATGNIGLVLLPLVVVVVIAYLTGRRSADGEP